MRTLSVRLLGGFSLAVEGEPVFTVNTPRLQSLLAYLLLHRHASISRDHLAFSFWPESSEPHARGSLRKLLHELRAALPCADTLIITDAHALRWNPSAPPDLDVDRFGRQASRTDCLPDLQQAVDLYRGDLLPDCYDEWILPERERLRQQYLAALERLADLAEGRGDYRAALAYAQRCLQYDPLSEEAYRRLMQLSALSGNRARVAWFYKACTTALHHELGVEPSAATQELYARCLDLASARRTPAPTAAPPGVPAAAGQAGNGNRSSNNLPSQMTTLVGRVREREEVRRLIGANRLLTMTGPPGVGKTRLALQVAADMLDQFWDGVWFVGLAPLVDPGLVVPTIAQVLGLRDTAGSPLSEMLKQFLRDRDALLVLDNFEQVLAAAGELGELLASCPQVRVLVTSRSPLRLSGEQEYSVRPLSLPALERSPRPGALPRALDSAEIAQIAQCESVRLFVERARSISPHFDLDPDNAPAVAQICVRLDGLPLAIELAAGRIRLFTPGTLLERLEHSLQFLTAGARDLPPRHRTLRSAIEWSYNLLPERRQELFRRMAVFAGGQSLEAIEAVCATPCESTTQTITRTTTQTAVPVPHLDLLEGVEGLVEHSLLDQREERNGEPRFFMLETIREYAQERLQESGEGPQLSRRHARYFFRLVEEAEPHLTGPEQQEWLDRLDDEHDNLRSAIQWTNESPGAGLEEVEAALRGVAGIRWFWMRRGHLTEGRAHLNGLLAKAAALPEPGCSRESRAKALNSASYLAYWQGAFPAAQPLAEEALGLARDVGYRAGMADALSTLAGIAGVLGNPRVAGQLNEESLAIWRELGDAAGIARSLSRLANVAVGEGDYRRARALIDESLAIARGLGDKALIGQAALSAGWVVTEEGDYAQARSLLEESLAIARDLGNKDLIGLAMAWLGELSTEEGDYEKAAALLEESLGTARELAEKADTAQTLQALGDLAYAQGDGATASARYEEGAALQREIGWLGPSLWFSGRAATERGQYTLARSLFARSLALSLEADNRKGVYECLAQLGVVSVDMGRARRGVVLLGAADGVMSRLGGRMYFGCRRPYERARASAQTQLSEEEFNEAWQEGQAMSMEEAVEYACEVIPVSG